MAVVDKEEIRRQDGLLLTRYDHVLAFTDIKFQAVTITPRHRDCLYCLADGKVGRCVNWVMKQDVITTQRHSSIIQEDHVIDEQELGLEELQNRLAKYQMKSHLHKHIDFWHRDSATSGCETVH